MLKSIAKEDQVDTARLLINAGSDLDNISVSHLMTWAIDWDLELIFSILGNRENFHRDAIQLDFHSLDWEMTLPKVDPSSFENFIKLCKRLNIDLSFTQRDGLTLLHSIIAERGYNGRSHHLKHALSALITNGVDICAGWDGCVTPTLIAFVLDRLDLWFTALRQTGISIEAVAAHALGLLAESNMRNVLTRMNHDLGRYRILDPILCRYIALSSGWRSIADATKLLRADLIEACERQGCYLSESGDKGNIVTHKASSSVDFKPPTVFDPERARVDFRRRTEGRKHPQ